jgi:hypothetical protein
MLTASVAALMGTFRGSFGTSFGAIRHTSHVGKIAPSAPATLWRRAWTPEALFLASLLVTSLHPFLGRIPSLVRLRARARVNRLFPKSLALILQLPLPPSRQLALDLMSSPRPRVAWSRWITERIASAYTTAPTVYVVFQFLALVNYSVTLTSHFISIARLLDALFFAK